VHEASLVGYSAITADEDVIGNGLAEYFYFEDVCDDFFGFAVEIGVDEGYVVVACDDVAQGGETFLHTLDRDGVGEAVPEVLEFLVGGCGRD
jgi:hypothetical protein